MNTCADTLTWTITHGVGVLLALAGLVLAIYDRRELNRHFAARVADESRRQLGEDMVRRMRRNAGHAIFAESMRLGALVCFTYVGVAALMQPARVCMSSVLVWILIVGGWLVVANTLHALWSRIGNNFADGPTDESDEARDKTRDAARDEGRDEIRDPARDTARDKEKEADEKSADGGA